MTAVLRSSGDPEPLLGSTIHYPEFGSTRHRAETLVAHQARLGGLPSSRGAAGAELIADLADCALAGRGGAHFPVAAKWRRVRDAAEWRRERPVVVANGAESEPLSAKDAALLEMRPHLVLDGLVCAAEALGAADAVLWLHEGATTVARSVARAQAERAAGSLDEPAVRVEIGPHRYLSGESSSIVSALSGGPALPMFRRVPAAESGVQGRPTLVQNVESLARVALVARGEQPPPTVLVTVAVDGHRSVVEADEGADLLAIVASVTGPGPLSAVLLGGYGGRWASTAELAGTSFDQAGLRARGLSLGAGVLMALRAGRCGLVRAAEIARYLADSSARQCGPCLFGLADIAELIAELADCTARRRDTARLERFLQEVNGRGACHHPDGAVAMVTSALATFRDDVAAHLRGGCYA